jgi:hypothetical protein
MGLDMYLTAKHYMFDFEPQEKIISESIANMIPESVRLPVKEISARAAQWRKSYQIHNWFVENVQDGEDNCGQYHVSEKQLFELLDTVNRVLENHDLAEELLPKQCGYFSQEYDDYFEDLEYTRNVLTKLLQPEYIKYWDFEYSSSW